MVAKSAKIDQQSYFKENERIWVVTSLLGSQVFREKHRKDMQRLKPLCIKAFTSLYKSNVNFSFLGQIYMIYDLIVWDKLKVTPHFCGHPSGKKLFAHYSSFTKILANYISEESFINVYDKNMSQATFLLRTCQDPIRREMTEGSSIEFIGYGMLQHELIRCTV